VYVWTTSFRAMAPAYAMKEKSRTTAANLLLSLQ
jgi:hypothetical protein